jgi:hypothetical protein
VAPVLDERARRLLLGRRDGPRRHEQRHAATRCCSSLRFNADMAGLYTPAGTRHGTFSSDGPGRYTPVVEISPRPP